MPSVNPMTAQLLLWLFSGITTLHLIGAALVSWDLKRMSC